MGAPVITASGNTYVSRMSTAVLEGCGLQEWVAADECSYVDLAIEQAANFTNYVRLEIPGATKLKLPLGDASDLMNHLERAFSAMVQSKVSNS